MESTSNFLSVFYTCKVLQNSIYAELKAWAGCFIILPTSQFFLQEKFALVYFIRQFFCMRSLLFVRDRRHIFTCSLLDVNWTFRSDAPPPSPTWDFAAPKVTAFSESLQFNCLLQHLHNLLSCWRCECRLQYSEKKTRIGNKRSPCFQRAFFMSLVHKRIYDISKLTYIWYRLTLIFFSHLGWNSKDHNMHRLLISSLLNYA